MPEDVCALGIYSLKINGTLNDTANFGATAIVITSGNDSVQIDVPNGAGWRDTLLGAFSVELGDKTLRFTADNSDPEQPMIDITNTSLTPNVSDTFSIELVGGGELGFASPFKLCRLFDDNGNGNGDGDGDGDGYTETHYGMLTTLSIDQINQLNLTGVIDFKVAYQYDDQPYNPDDLAAINSISEATKSVSIIQGQPIAEQIASAFFFSTFPPNTWVFAVFAWPHPSTGEDHLLFTVRSMVYLPESQSYRIRALTVPNRNDIINTLFAGQPLSPNFGAGDWIRHQAYVRTIDQSASNPSVS